MFESLLFAFLQFQICKAELRHALSLKVASRTGNVPTIFWALWPLYWGGDWGMESPFFPLLTSVVIGRKLLDPVT